MHTTLSVIQVVSAILLTVLVLLQVKGNGFGRVWGTGAQSFSRRGLEAFVFKFTFVVSFVFLTVSIASFII